MEIPKYVFKAYAMLYLKYKNKTEFKQSELDWITSTSMKKKIFSYLLRAGWIKKAKRDTYKCVIIETIMEDLFKFKVPEIITKAEKDYAFTMMSAAEIWSDYSYIRRSWEHSPYFIKVLRKDLSYWGNFFRGQGIPVYTREGTTIGEFVILVPVDELEFEERNELKIDSINETITFCTKNYLFERIKNNILNKNIYKHTSKPSSVMKRTNTCGELTKKDNNKEVTLCGWLNSRRDHGGIIFIDLRDRYGLTQIVFDPKHEKEAHKKAEHLGREDVLQVKGKVRLRGKGLENPKLKTGEIEVIIDELTILNKAETPPIEIDQRIEINEDMRLKYRYLDLRKPNMQNNLRIRHTAIKAVRDFYDSEGFLEIETPMLAKSTPEGARDYLVPSRVNPGKFFALPQSPQLFKQLLMVSGCDRYFQIVKCFRDEDLRADRQPEFTQIDVEMSFIDEEDIYDIHERLMKDIWKKVLNIDIKIPFKRLTYEDAMDRYGSDKPDTRFGLELVDITDIVKTSAFKVFTDNIKSGGVVKAINVRKSPLSRKDIDELMEFVKIYGAKGLAWIKVTDSGLESSIVKYFDEKTQKELGKKLKTQKGDLLLFVSGHKHFTVNDALGNLRVHLGKKLGLIPDNYSFVWVTDFPLVEYDEDEERHMAVHHPFTSPKDEDMELLDKDPSKAKAKAYDLTLNGVEIGGGSIRIHKREVQEKIFSILGISKEEAQQKFGFLLEAFRYGAPPHGGIAFGMDRIVALLTGNESIREVIAFPKTKSAESLMEGSPSDVDDKQLKELHIKLDIVKKGS